MKDEQSLAVAGLAAELNEWARCLVNGRSAQVGSILPVADAGIPSII